MRGLYATLSLLDFQVHRHVKVTPLHAYIQQYFITPKAPQQKHEKYNEQTTNERTKTR